MGIPRHLSILHRIFIGAPKVGLQLLAQIFIVAPKVGLKLLAAGFDLGLAVT